LQEGEEHRGLLVFGEVRKQDTGLRTGRCRPVFQTARLALALSPTAITTGAKLLGQSSSVLVAQPDMVRFGRTVYSQTLGLCREICPP